MLWLVENRKEEWTNVEDLESDSNKRKDVELIKKDKRSEASLFKDEIE